MLANDQMNPLFSATIEAVEEAIVNAMVGAETMTGNQGHTVSALPHDRVRQMFK
jgi:D-aminopeptidase